MSAHALSPPDSRPAAGAAARSVLARRMAFVTGKSGVGKTTVSAALALAEWMARTVARPGAALLGRSDAFRYFVAAAPGARELVGIGKAWDLTRPRGATREGRLVVVDAPSSGHAVGLLQAPRTFSRLGGPGPIGHTPREGRHSSSCARSRARAATASKFGSPRARW